jgi:LPS export ABC transporter permease LptG
MKILDKYLLREFTYAFLGVLFICAVVLLIYMVIESYDDILQNEPSLYHIIVFFVNSLPFKMIQILPLAVVVAVLFTITHMTKNNEVIALVSSGVSPLRIGLPLFLATVVISIGTFWFNEYVVPGCEERARYVGKAFIEGKGEKIITQSKDIFVKGKGRRFYIMKGFDSQTNTMTNPVILDLYDNSFELKQRIDASRAELLEKSPRERYWKFYDAILWHYSPQGEVVSMERPTAPIEIPMEEDLAKFLSNRKQPEEMNYSELRQYIRILRNRGENVSRFMTDLNLKIAFPLASIIISVIAFSFAVRTRARNIVIAFAWGIVFAILFYGVAAFSQALGHQMILPGVLAAWAPDVLFAAFGLYLLYDSSHA